MEAFSILSGIALVVLAFLPNSGLTSQRKAGVVALGALFAGYGLYVMNQDSGTWTFPAIIFALPFVVGFEVIRQLREHRRRTAQGQPTPTPAAVPGPPATSTLEADVATPARGIPAVSHAAAPTCEACGARLRPTVRFCTQCGVARPTAAVTPPPTALPGAALPGAALPGAALPRPAGPWAGRHPAARPAWQLPVLIAAGAVAAVVVVAVIWGQVSDRGPSAGEQASVAGALMAAATESACVNPAIEGQYFAEEIAAVISEDTWVDSPVYPAVVEAPFAQLAMTCGYDYGLAALNSVGIVGVTYRAIDGAMLAAAPPVIAEPEPEPVDEGGIKVPSPADDEPLVVPARVTLWGGGAIGDAGHFAPAEYVITTLNNELGAYDSVDEVSCSDGAIQGLQYRWGDFVVFVDDEGFTYDHPAGGTVTVEAPYVGGWMLAPGDGSRTGLRTAEGLGKDDSVADLDALYPDAYVAGPGAPGTVAWEYFGGDLSSYVFETTGEGPDDVVVSIRSGTACDG